ncbi:MAG: phenylalanine--tRNA ligase subunit beta [Fibrobacterales bacterium]
MLASLSWLQRYVDLSGISPEKIEAALTSLGLEVEGLENTGEAYRDLIVGKVRERTQHPDADKLSVTKLFDGTNEIQVVCGAPNVDAGQTVVFAPVGSKLPTEEGAKPFKIKKAKIRGVESLGMICAEDEIGLGESHDGIMVLDESLEAGTKINTLPGFYDVIFEVNVTPNRPDALSHIGIARELAAFFDKELTMPEFELQESTESIEGKVTIEVEEECGCTKYTGRIIKGVSVGESPSWLKRFLLTVGITPINNVVDVTNFILMKTGQPLHAFDYDSLKTKNIIVRNANEGEKLITLDHVERELIESDMVICDGDEPICLGGVMGGESTEISDTTKDVFLEVAYFTPSVVRKQARRLSIHSDASHRFERGVSPFQQEAISELSAAMIADVCGGEVLKGSIIDTAPDHKNEPDTVSIRMSRIKRILGIEVPKDRVISLMEGIGLQKVADTEDSVSFLIPGYRPDLQQEVDLIEEVVQKVGFDDIPTIFPSFELALNELPKNERVGRASRAALSASGLSEGLSLRFDSVKSIEKVFTEGDPRTNVVALKNPISEELGVMQTSLIPTMLNAVAQNEKNHEKAVRLYEISKAFFDNTEARSDRDPGTTEKEIVSGVIAGDFDYTSVPDKPTQASFLDLKGIIENFFSTLHIDISIVRSDRESYLHPHKQADVYLGDLLLGSFGELHPAIQKAFDIKMSTVVFELDFDPIIDAGLEVRTFKAFFKGGKMTREISMQVDLKLDHQAILDKVSAIRAKNLVSVDLKSIYTGEGVPEGKKAVLYQFTYQSNDTLTDKEVNKAQERIAQKLAEDSDIEYR